MAGGPPPNTPNTACSAPNPQAWSSKASKAKKTPAQGEMTSIHHNSIHIWNKSPSQNPPNQIVMTGISSAIEPLIRLCTEDRMNATYEWFAYRSHRVLRLR